LQTLAAVKVNFLPIMQPPLRSAERIRGILSRHGRLVVSVDTLQETSDLYSAGLTSLATVGLMLAIENELGIEFPDNLLGRRTFQSIQAIAEAVERLAGVEQVAGE